MYYNLAKKLRDRMQNSTGFFNYVQYVAIKVCGASACQQQ